MNTFKFFKGPAKKERVFTDWMDMMDDYHLGGIQPVWNNIEIPEGYEFEGVTPTYYEPMTLSQSKYVLIKDIESGIVTKYVRIYQGDPLWNHNNRL